MEGSFAERLYAENIGWLTSYCLSLTREASAAQDMAQDVMLKALMHTAEMESLSLPQIRAYLCRTARNLFTDKMRHENVMRKRETMGVDIAIEEGYESYEVASLLSLLPLEDQILFRQRYFEGYTSAELGELYDEKPAHIRWRLKRIRDRLKGLLSQSGGYL